MKSLLSTALLAGTLALGAANAQVYVRVGPPPPPRREFIPARPGPQYVWIAGFQRWDGARYVYVPGRWVLPPGPRYRQWVPGHWRNTRHGWIWVEGHWR
ncbi:MAG: YXWGXW repeat-containing protein [Acidobacteriaceae bacterium]|nr:YXWGXW repeat-containing protein [Acidobacteriaceae bacterium]